MATPQKPDTSEECLPDVGNVVPEIRRDRCEGKRACEAVCPHDVFEVRRIDDADFEQLSFLGRLKSRVHGRLTAYTPGEADCHACGLCVTACPEDAIRLVPRRS